MSMNDSRTLSARIGRVAPSATLAVDIKAKSMKAAGVDVIGFGAGEPNFPTPDYVVQAAQEACRDPRNHRYTPTAGLPELRQAIADKTLRERRAHTVTHVAAASGIPTVLTCAANAGPALMGDGVGTAFAPVKHRGSFRRLWIGFASDPRGTLVADEGAAKAVRGGRASLLAAGVLAVRGDFSAGDSVWIDDEHGTHLAKGLVAFDSEEMPSMLGRTTVELRRSLGGHHAHPLVHRDDLVLV